MGWYPVQALFPSGPQCSSDQNTAVTEDELMNKHMQYTQYWIVLMETGQHMFGHHALRHLFSLFTFI